MTVYSQLKHAVFVLLLSGAVFMATPASAAILFESGTLGTTGVNWQQALDGEVPATSVDGTVFIGVRFQLMQPVVTTQIGGHFFAPSNGTFFGAIIELDDENDFPDSNNLSTPDVLGSTVLAFPEPSDEVYGNLSIAIDTGWYALVFGSGLFGANANGGTVRNGIDIGDPSYIMLQPLSPFGWVNHTTSNNSRFVVQGTIIPEPTALALTTVSCLLLLFGNVRLNRDFQASCSQGELRYYPY